ncbi:carbon monoxide dehydrogenase [Candidatus Formimonas warabiya]|uniref:Carbon monoxide dehydrogenase n=2 Tax=Formimonas warabiya TaxID=1761012 RepID=A0A3G1KTT3_FORW1|nr:carbon monoxide dehydrogenase [Candidatus Formimonas warabiya]
MPLMGGKDYKILNKPVPRVDAVDKVTGRAQYAADLKFPAMLVGGCLRSGLSHANVVRIDTSKAKETPGVKAVLTAADIPKPQSWADYMYITDKIKYVGDVVAIIAAEDKESLEDAMKAIEVIYEELDGVYTIDDALKTGTVQVREKGVGLVDGIPTPGTKGNVFMDSYFRIRKGNVEEAFKQCDVIIEREYRTQFVEHAYIEPEACVAVSHPADGIMTVYSSSQNPFFSRRYIADALQCPMNKTRLVQQTLGGSFGGKEELAGLNVGRAALLARATGRPVQMILSREDSILESSKRHPFRFRYKIGATKEGRILALESELIDNSGAYNNQTQYMNCRASIHSAGVYQIPNVKNDTFGVFTNNIHSGAFRGYSSPQIIFAQESLMEELAEALNMDIIELKRKNLLRQYDLTATSQKLVQPTLITEMMEHMLESTDFVAKRENYQKQKVVKRKGIGLVTCYRGCGFGAESPDASGAMVTALEDGTVMIHSGISENGQGLKTAYAQIVAESLGVKVDDIHHYGIDTHAIADSGMSVASRGTVMGAQSIKKAAEKLKKLLLETGAELLHASPLDEVEIEDSMCFAKSNPDIKLPLSAVCATRLWSGKQLSVYEWFEPKPLHFDHGTGQGDVFPTYSYACVVAEVEVDLETGCVDVLKVSSGHDCGTVINSALAKGQIYGGIAMGMGFAVMEEVEVNRGRVGNKNFDAYIFPTAMDVPAMEAVLFECDDKEGTFGAKSLGEPALEGVGAAIASAVNSVLINAKGVRLRRLPFDLERVLLGKSLRAGGNS